MFSCLVEMLPVEWLGVLEAAWCWHTKQESLVSNNLIFVFLIYLFIFTSNVSCQSFQTTHITTWSTLSKRQLVSALPFVVSWFSDWTISLHSFPSEIFVFVCFKPFCDLQTNWNIQGFWAPVSPCAKLLPEMNFSSAVQIVKPFNLLLNSRVYILIQCH